MMGSRRFEITIVSAENLPDIRRLGRMKVFAEVSFNGSTKQTSTDREGDTNPRWDYPFVYNINEAYLQRPGSDVVVDLYCERTLGNKIIGRVIIPVKSCLKRESSLRKASVTRSQGLIMGDSIFATVSRRSSPPPPPPPPRGLPPGEEAAGSNGTSHASP